MPANDVVRESLVVAAYGVAPIWQDATNYVCNCCQVRLVALVMLSGKAYVSITIALGPPFRGARCWRC